MNMETTMTDLQATRYDLYTRFYQVQLDIDRTTDQETKAQLEETKKELIARLETYR